MTSCTIAAIHLTASDSQFAVILANIFDNFDRGRLICTLRFLIIIALSKSACDTSTDLVIFSDGLVQQEVSFSSRGRCSRRCKSCSIAWLLVLTVKLPCRLQVFLILAKLVLRRICILGLSVATADTTLSHSVNIVLFSTSDDKVVVFHDLIQVLEIHGEEARFDLIFTLICQLTLVHLL